MHMAYYSLAYAVMLIALSLFSSGIHAGVFREKKKENS